MSSKIKEKIFFKKEKKSRKSRFLILHNDEKNRYEYVIETLMEICEHDIIQAEQCTFITHHKGKCDVKKGSVDFLKPFLQKLMLKGLSATIE